MPRLYCLCAGSRNAARILDPNDYSVILLDPCKVIKTGAEQYLSETHRHYPNVDLHLCPNCGRVIAVE